MNRARLRHNLEKGMLFLITGGMFTGVGTVIYLKKVEGIRLKIDLNTDIEDNDPSKFLDFLPNLINLSKKTSSTTNTEEELPTPPATSTTEK
jgi:hypothetical protein